MTKKFFLGLDPEICRTVEAIDPKTYEEALRTAKALEKPRDEVWREQPIIIGRKWSYDRETQIVSHQRVGAAMSTDLPSNKLRDTLPDVLIDTLGTKMGQRKGGNRV